MSRYWFPLILKTVHFPTTSAFEKVFRTSTRLFHVAFFVIRNQTSRRSSRSACRAEASLSFLRLITCMPSGQTCCVFGRPLCPGSHYANYCTSQNAKLSSWMVVALVKTAPLERVDPGDALSD